MSINLQEEASYLKFDMEELQASGELLQAYTKSGPSVRFATYHSSLVKIQGHLTNLGIPSIVRPSPSNGNIEVENAGNAGRRVPNMNYIASKIIEKEVGDGAFVALVGAAHCANLTIQRYDGLATNTPGLDTLCNAYSLAIQEQHGVSPRCTERGTISDDNPFHKDKLEPDLLLKTDRKYISTPEQSAIRTVRQKSTATQMAEIPTNNGNALLFIGNLQALGELRAAFDNAHIETSVETIGNQPALRVRTQFTDKVRSLLSQNSTGPQKNTPPCPHESEPQSPPQRYSNTTLRHNKSLPDM